MQRSFSDSSLHGGQPTLTPCRPETQQHGDLFLPAVQQDCRTSAESTAVEQSEVLDVLEDADRYHSPREKTTRPVIGILSLEVSPTVQKYCGEHDSYIAASYVKFVEGAGAQAAPVLIGQSPEYYRDMVKRVNGLLLPGGATYFDGKANGYEAAGRELLRLAKELNEAGDYFPVLGICLGMELIAVEAAGEDFRERCTSESPRPHRFLLGSIRSSRLFGRAPASVVNILGRENATANHHSWCVTQRGLNSRGLHRDWRSLTTSDDDQGFEYVSIMEHRRQPVYGLMFHPEKSIYEWKRTKNYPHSATAVAANRYFADFLVSEARRNNHSFPAAEERSHLMYGHQPVDTKGKLMWEQLYFFDEEAS